MNTKLAAEVMQEVAKKRRSGMDWVMLGQLISKEIEENPKRKAADIADEVIEACLSR